MLRVGTAGDFCRNVTGFAAVFNRTLFSVGQTADERDLYSGNRVGLAIQCASLGNFNVENGFRSHLLNESFYRRICGDIGVDINVSMRRMKDLFGGTRQGSSAVLFAYSRNDINSAAMSVMQDLSRDRVVVATNDPAGYSLNKTDNETMQIFLEWRRDPCLGDYKGLANDLRHARRAHGDTVLRHCKCKVGWSGKHCEKEYITMNRFRGLATMATAIPTIVVFMTSIVAWKTILVDPETAKSKPIVL
jgi:hypothetical protein